MNECEHVWLRVDEFRLGNGVLAACKKTCNACGLVIEDWRLSEALEAEARSLHSSTCFVRQEPKPHRIKRFFSWLKKRFVG